MLVVPSMRSVRGIVFPAVAGAWLAAAGCGGHTSPNCVNNIYGEGLPDAGDLTGATISTSESMCGTYVGDPGYVNVSRTSPGTCHVQVTLASGAIYGFSVTFAATGTDRCQGAIRVVDASSAVLLDPGRCYPPQDGSAGTTGDAGTADASVTTDADASTVLGPACAGLRTGNGVQPMRACGCGPTDPQLCYQRCGPEDLGAKLVTCTAGVYAQAPVCVFDPAGDYACYRVPTEGPNPSCPINASGINVLPQDRATCAVDHCVICNSFGGLPSGEYLYDRGATRVGYCVCRPPDSTGHRSWSCADDSDWPCASGC